ncbi:hypothetical protein SDC9_27269 [bioreactor metagenome]|uniref:Integrase catalytic domain-containing protein n=1 Tax=bioreactor metagenome TaxID=1076179 RepID=A0A644URC9_9ZZZZ
MKALSCEPQTCLSALRKLDIQSVIRKKRRHFGKSRSTVFPNLLGCNFKVQLPTKKISTDVTYLPTTSSFVYLSVVQDLCSNEVVARPLIPKGSGSGVRNIRQTSANARRGSAFRSRASIHSQVVS